MFQSDPTLTKIRNLACAVYAFWLGSTLLHFIRKKECERQCPGCHQNRGKLLMIGRCIRIKGNQASYQHAAQGDLTDASVGIVVSKLKSSDNVVFV